MICRSVESFNSDGNYVAFVFENILVQPASTVPVTGLKQKSCPIAPDK